MTIIHRLYEIQRKSPITDSWVVTDSYINLEEARKTKKWCKSKEPKRKLRIVEKKERVVE